MKSASLNECATCSSLFSRKTQNDAADTHPSNLEIAAQVETMHNMQHLPHVEVVPESLFHVQAVTERVHHGGGWLLSGIICINVLILGCALVSSSALTSTVVAALHRQIFLIILLLLTMLWMLLYTVFISRKDQAVLYKDSHAGPVWLRVGLVLFGLLSLLMDIFKIANFVGYLHCESAVEVAFSVVQAVFLFVQTYFLWIHAKDCVQLYTHFTRCGLSLMLSTNLVMWMAAVIDESVQHVGVPDLNVSVSNMIYRVSYGEECNCNCSHSCDSFEEALYYLYPFNLEYCLFASAMAYVMWKNVGRLVEDHSRQKVKLHSKDVCLGPLTGILLLVAGLVTFILYKVDILKGDNEKRNKALLIHFIVNIVILSLMSVSTVVGCIVYKLDPREHVSEKNPTRSLDVGLLVITSMGQFIISYFTIVAVMATGATGYLDALNLTWAVLAVLELGLQNYFIIEGLHREPFYVMQEAAVRTSVRGFPEHTEMSILMKHSKTSYVLSSRRDKPSWKRRVLKEVCAFLLLANIILWIMPAFGARPQFQHLLELKFYKFTMWAAIVNVGLPFGIFYRMHSVANLVEVYLIS